MIEPTQRQIDRAMEVICMLCMNPIDSDEPRVEIMVGGIWTVAHENCAEMKTEEEE